MAAFPLGFAVVSGRSMEPTLYAGDRLLVRYGARPVAGRLAVVRLPAGGPLAVKRLVSHLADGWWVQRDNPVMGVDSAQVGTIPDSDVIACVVARVWPLIRSRRAADRPAAGSPSDG